MYGYSERETMNVNAAKGTGKRRRRSQSASLDGVNVDRQSLRKDLGHRLRAAREQKNIGLRELARRLGVSASLISQIETGKTEPSINTLFAMVSELELPVNEIVFDSSRDATSPGAEGGLDAASRDGSHIDDGPASPVQRGHSRRSINLESGVSWQRLTAQ